MSQRGLWEKPSSGLKNKMGVLLKLREQIYHLFIPLFFPFFHSSSLSPPPTRQHSCGGGCDHKGTSRGWICEGGGLPLQLEDLRSQECGDTRLLLFILSSSTVGHRGSPNTKAFSKVEELELQDLGHNPEKERLRQPENAEKRAKRKDFLKASP